MPLLRHLPNALTCCNLLCGVLGIAMLFETPYYTVWFVATACVFDFLDGFAARMLKVSSPIGKELDSLADMVTFGVLPSMFLYSVLQEFHIKWLPLLAFLIVVSSALRLAKFNIDERQTDGFIGVPTPATALFITTFYLIVPNIESIKLPIVIVVILLFSWLMVSPLRLFALKFKNFKWAGNELRFTFLISAVLLIGIFQVAGIALTIILYILASLVSNSVRPKKM
jgi:CDP-diacylglycerol--serine O-phosphatidyltransferase